MLRRSYAIVFMFFVGPLFADITVTESNRSEGFGGVGGGQGVTIRYLSGDKMREEKTMTLSNALIGKMGGNENSAVITRIDKELRWELFPKKKAFTESPLFPKFESSSTPEGKTEPTPQTPAEKPTHRISKTSFTVKKTGVTKTINGFPCKQYIITGLIETEEIETKAKSEMKMVTTQWTTPTTPELKKAETEVAAYYSAFAKKAGFESPHGDKVTTSLPQIAGMVGADEKNLEKSLQRVADEVKKVEGYPISTTIEWFMKSNEKTADAPSPDAPEDGAVPVSGDVGGMLGGLAGQWAEKKAANAVKPKQAGAGAPVMSWTTEIQSVKTNALPESTFDVPTTYKRIKS